MRITFIFTSLIIFSFCKESFSQSNLHFTQPDFHFNEGIALINEGKYGAAMGAFTKYLEEGKEPEEVALAEYYKAYCSIQLDHNDAEHLVENFIKKYPSHSKSETAYFELGNLKYDRKQYDDAIRFYERLYLPNLTKEQQAEARFKMGYSYFTKREFDKAYEQFNELKKEDNKFQYASSYYSGYINFQKEEYDRAYYDFMRAAENEYYAQVVPELISKTLYKQKKYDEVIKYSKEALKNNEIKSKDEFYLYLGEAYYKKSDFQNSTQYFNDYLKITKKNISPEIMFRIADAKQRSSDPTGAIEGFKEVALESNALGQMASYYLGNLYIQTDNKNLAPAAFKAAMDLDFNKDIQQKSQFLYAKVNYELGNYSVAISTINEYLSKYPEEVNSIELNEILTDSFFRTNNYEAAIKHFDRIQIKSEKVKAAYQHITFNEGSRQFNLANYYDAINLFEKSLEYPVMKDLEIKANFWKGEAYYLIRQFDDAQNSYSAVFTLDHQGSTEEYLKSRYGIGYIYFNEKNYERALPHFQYFVERGRENINYLDALTRLADCQYTTKEYQAALKSYDLLIKYISQNSDYAYYQKGLISGITNNIGAANTNFDRVINAYPKSVYVDDAMFQRAQLNFENGNYNEAISGFNQLINTQLNSSFIAYALQSRALAKANTGDHKGSANDYKRILEEYPNHSVSENALLGLQQELTALGQSDQFSTYLQNYKSANPDKNNLENIEFEAAKSLYFSQNYSEAITAFEKFLKSYRNSSFSHEAIYYGADSYYRISDLKNSLSTFKKLKDATQYARYARVIERISEIEFQLKNYSEAIHFARKAEAIASSKKSLYNSWNMLLESYYNLRKYDSVDYYANTILEKGLVTAEAENKALLYLGKSSYERKYYEAATDYFLTALNTAKDEYGAESQYLLARIYYEQGKYQNSLETLFNLSKNFSIYEYWLGKSFLLIADNYIAVDEKFQAKATLESIIENATLDEVIREALVKLDQLEASLPKSEIAPDTLEIVNPE